MLGYAWRTKVVLKVPELNHEWERIITKCKPDVICHCFTSSTEIKTTVVNVLISLM